jgi:hypothetical protein
MLYLLPTIYRSAGLSSKLCITLYLPSTGWADSHLRITYPLHRLHNEHQGGKPGFRQHELRMQTSFIVAATVFLWADPLSRGSWSWLLLAHAARIMDHGGQCSNWTGCHWEAVGGSGMTWVVFPFLHLFVSFLHIWFMTRITMGDGLQTPRVHFQTNFLFVWLYGHRWDPHTWTLIQDYSNKRFYTILCLPVVSQMLNRLFLMISQMPLADIRTLYQYSHGQCIFTFLKPWSHRAISVRVVQATEHRRLE